MNKSLRHKFLIVALSAGIASGSAGIGIPLQVVAAARPAAFMGILLALLPLGAAAGALITALIRNRVGNAGSTLGQSVVVSGLGCLILITPVTTMSLFGGGALVGIGSGIFWVCSQVILSSNAGLNGSESSFLEHFAVYTGGVLTGSVATGLFVAVAEAEGAPPLWSTRMSFIISLAASAIAYRAWWPKRLTIRDAAGKVPACWKVLTTGFSLQTADFFIVAALSIVSLLAPLVLLDTFSFSSFAVGLVAGGIAIGKIVGTMISRVAVRALGVRSTLILSLTAGLAACLILAFSSHTALFVAALLWASLSIAGVWPLVVAAAHAQTLSTQRGGAAVAWNAREYAVIAVSGAVGTWLYAASNRFVMFLAATFLVLLAIVFTARLVTGSQSVAEGQHQS